MAQSAPLIISLVATAASTAVAVSSQIQQGKAAKAAARFNAAQLENEAIKEELEGREERRRQRIADRRFRAAQRVGFAQSGVVTTEGTPLEVLSETATNQELFIQDALRVSQAKGVQLRGGAAIELFEGQAQSRAFKTGAGATLLSGASRISGSVAASR